jgi:hypothetical protein
MKQFKFVFALLAIVFAVSSAFTTKHAPVVKSSTEEYLWFTYSSEATDPTDADNYYYLANPDDCEAATGATCKIQILRDPLFTETEIPLQSSLDALATAAGNDFETAFDGEDEQINLKIRVQQ